MRISRLLFTSMLVERMGVFSVLEGYAFLGAPAEKMIYRAFNQQPQIALHEDVLHFLPILPAL